MEEEKVLLKAEFDPRVCGYWLISGVLILTVTIVAIPLLLVWIPLGLLFTHRYLKSHECILTDRAVRIKKGILNRVEKTVPLEKITDVGWVQGPVMRAFGVECLSVETAGSTTAGALVRVMGVKDARKFREAVLTAKDAARAREAAAGDANTPQPGVASAGTDALGASEAVTLLREIRDSLKRLESK